MSETSLHKKMTSFAIVGPQIYAEDHVYDQMALIVEHGYIQSIQPIASLDPSMNVLKYPRTYHVIPGMIDMHVHGAANYDVMDANTAALKAISHALAKEGTTGYLATTMTDTEPKINQVLLTVKEYIATQSPEMGAQILGVHLEGPFISPEKVGAQRLDAVKPLDINLFDKWQALSNHHIRLVTLAPELSGAENFIQHLARHHVIASLGHSAANAAQAEKGIAAGISHATHLFNAMTGVDHYQPGAAVAILVDKRVMAELIVDGVHLHPDIVKFSLMVKGKEHLVLVTDAMRAKCCGEGLFDLGGQEVVVKNGQARLQSNGRLAGSVLKMNEALRNMIKFTDCSLADAIMMTSRNPAKSLKIDDKLGSIKKDKQADLVVLDEAYQVVATFIKGRQLIRQEGS